MLRFIKKSIVFLLVLSIMVGYVNARYKQTNIYKSINGTDKFYYVPQNIDIGNLGTSHAQYAFVYEDLDLVGFNFALPAQRVYYDEKIFEKYIENFKEGSTVIIPISYISFYLGYDNENFEDFNKMYYPFLSIKDIKKPKLNEYLKYKALPIITAESNIKYAFIKEEKAYEPKPTYRVSTMPIDKMKEESNDTAGRHLEFIEEGRKDKDKFVAIVDDILATAIKNNIKPVITTTPFTIYYNEHFSEDFYKEFEETIDKLLEKYPDVKYLDYSHDPRFENSPEYFFDSSHLNLEGGKLFTKIILEDIR
ncbi:SGNH/GDSL hydrolase family protein [Tissierella sp. MB52-C2]|uniref:SGNH/GDSL hydrolase family protein n=1 Tax=Tissierella sp. MB52-C2 TaxID=3070999 RepID=UPI00280AC8D0|nr:SGNH/GDSL hydrolase family protein [Tissierella sp. MB52-C2]WMM24314.1 SGNH/GDSL hydrolase family protein [Tissierella sp. MB52-C2]